MKRKFTSTETDLQSKIKALRRFLSLSQQELGSRLGSTAITVSRWEQGKAKPPVKASIRMGNIAGAPRCWYFWERAGLRIAEMKRALSLDEERRPRLNSGQLVHAGRKRAQAGQSSRREALLGAPSVWCQNPASIVFLPVKGNSMSPLIRDGYIIAVDTAEVRRDALVGKIVVAQHPEHGLLVSRLLRFARLDVLVSDDREYSSVSLDKNSEWEVVGKVLWWTGRPPQPATEMASLEG